MTAHIPGRMETPSPGGPTDLESIQGCTGRPVCLPGLLPLPALLLPDQGPPQHGHIGTQLAQGPTQIRVSHREHARTDTVQGQGGRGADIYGCFLLVHLVPGLWT
jgi:hypothetical protein